MCAMDEKLEQETIELIKSKLTGWDQADDHTMFDTELTVFLKKAGYVKLAEFYEKTSCEFFWYA